MVIINSTLVKKGGDVGFRILGPTLYKNKAFSNIRAFCFKPDGTELYYTRQNDTSVYQYTLSTPWDVTTATYTSAFTSSLSGADSIALSSDGLNMYLSSGTGILQHTLSTPWDISTATYSQTSSEVTVKVFQFNQSGSKIFYKKTANSYIYYATLSTPWDVSTIGATFSKSGIVGAYDSFRFSVDGTKFYSGYNNTLNEYHLTTPFDVSTASSLKTSFDTKWVNANAFTNFIFSVDGLYLYFCGEGIDAIYQLKMPQ